MNGPDIIIKCKVEDADFSDPKVSGFYKLV